MKTMLQVCWETRRQAPSLTWNPELLVALWTDERLNNDGFLIAFECVNNGKMNKKSHSFQQVALNLKSRPIQRQCHEKACSISDNF